MINDNSMKKIFISNKALFIENLIHQVHSMCVLFFGVEIIVKNVKL